MKKILSVLLAMLFCVSTAVGAITAISAEETSDLSDHLILHYDFEGETDEEKLKDKAHGNGASKSDDSLSLVGTNGEGCGIVFADGTVTQTNPENKIVIDSLPYLSHATESADLKTLTSGEMTFTARFKITEEFDPGYDWIAYLFDTTSADGVSTPLNVQIQKSGKELRLIAGLSGTSNVKWVKGPVINIADYYNTAAPQWINMVFRISGNATDGWTAYVAYYLGNPVGNETWTDNTAKVRFGTNSATDPGSRTTAETKEDTNIISMFTKEKAAGIVVDDIKVYDKALTNAEYKKATRLSDYMDYLVTHYDFKGDTPEEALKDKAHGNGISKSDDSLSIIGTNGDGCGIVFENGTMGQLDPDSKIAFDNVPYLQNQSETADLIDLTTGQAAITLRFKLSKEFKNQTEETAILYTTEAVTPGETSGKKSVPFMITVTRQSGNLLQFVAGMSSEYNVTWAKGASYTAKAVYDYNESPWINLVVSIEGDNAAGWRPVVFVYFGDPNLDTQFERNGATFRYGSESASDKDWKRLNIKTDDEYSNYATIFKNVDACGITFDDIKIYSKSLSTTEARIAATIDTINYEGHYTTAAKDGKYSIRFVSSVRSLEFKSAGIEVEAVCGETTKKFESTNTTSVYKKILGSTSDGTAIKEVATSDTDYLFCLTVTGLPTGQAATFNVRTYAIDDSGCKIYSDIYVVTVNADGSSVTALK